MRRTAHLLGRVRAQCDQPEDDRVLRRRTSTVRRPRSGRVVPQMLLLGLVFNAIAVAADSVWGWSRPPSGTASPTLHASSAWSAVSADSRRSASAWPWESLALHHVSMACYRNLFVRLMSHAYFVYTGTS